MRRFIGVFVVALLIASGCSEDDETPSNSPVDLNGNSLGIAIATGGTFYPPNRSYPITFELVQTGTVVTGQYNTADVDTATSGTVSGTISGRTFNFTFTETTPCAGTFTGTANIDSNGTSFSGLYSGADCIGTTEAGFSASPVSLHGTR